MFGASHSGSSSTKAFHWEKRGRLAGRSHEAGIPWEDEAGAAERSRECLGGGGRTKGPRTYFETGERSTLEYLYVFRWARASSEMHSATALSVGDSRQPYNLVRHRG